MSICRTTIVELNSEEDTDALIADYIQNFDSMFPECEQTLNSKVGPTTVVSNSVYADQEAIEKTGSGWGFLAPATSNNPGTRRSAR